MEVNMPIEFTAEQAKEVMGNPQNEYYQRYKSNDGQIVEAVSQGLLKGDASLKNLNPLVELPVAPPAGDYRGAATLRPQQPGEPAVQPQQQQQTEQAAVELDPQVKATVQTVESYLRNDQEFGGNFQAMSIQR
jgi:hypothetical protein